MINNREDLIHVLTEAAEIEHNLLCSYLYALFSLKRAGEGGLSDIESLSVETWRATILSVAIEEMAHLACVNNLLLAVGGGAHFDRPNFPVSPGYHPASVVVCLAPFTSETLKHFIFLERPQWDSTPEGRGFEHSGKERENRASSLTPSAINYRTVGDLYDAVAEGFKNLASKMGETALFALGERGQVDAKQTGMKSVERIGNLKVALAVIEHIKEEGEGSSGAQADGHFDRFQNIQREWTSLLTINPGFEPAWPAAHNPVMRKPYADNRVWIHEGTAACYLDCGNAAYGFMLTVLQQACSEDNVSLQASFLKLGIALMKLVAIFGNALARMPAGAMYPGRNAGLTFTVPRNLGARVGGMAHQLAERLDDLEVGMTKVLRETDRESVRQAFKVCRSTIPLNL